LYCGTQQEGIVKAEAGAEAGGNTEDATSASLEDVPWQFDLEKSKRRKPMGIITQIIIFFAAFALVGFIVLLLS
jgi:hypothetical protein